MFEANLELLQLVVDLLPLQLTTDQLCNCDLTANIYCISGSAFVRCVEKLYKVKGSPTYNQIDF